MHNDIIKLLPKIYFPNVIFYGDKSFFFYKDVFLNRKIFIVISGGFKEINKKFCEELFCGQAFYFVQDSEPSKEDFEKIQRAFRDNPFDLIVALGGGSVIDLAKLLKKDKKLEMVAIPTTIGAGAEVSQHCILMENGTKKAHSDHNFLPETVILNPVFLLSLSGEQIASQAIDALAHALEGLVSRLSSPLSDAFCLYAIDNLYGGLIDFLEKGARADILARLQIASVFSGLAQSNVGTGLIHSFAHCLGARNKISHALAVCAPFLEVIKFNASHTDKYQKLSQLKHLSPNDFIGKIQDLLNNLGLNGKVILECNLEEAAEEIKKDICTTTNPSQPSIEDIVSILKKVIND